MFAFASSFSEQTIDGQKINQAFAIVFPSATGANMQVAGAGFASKTNASLGNDGGLSWSTTTNELITSVWGISQLFTIEGKPISWVAIGE